jgi:hypothetical protein
MDEQKPAAPQPTQPAKGTPFVALKILLALLPAIIFAQNVAWMTLNRGIGIGFLVMWALMVWSVWPMTEKNHVVERLARLTEIAFFLLPLSALVLSLMFSSKVSEIVGDADGFAQAGAYIGAGLGGILVLVISFVIGMVGGIVFHIISGKYGKGAEAAGVKRPASLSGKHGLILSLVGFLVLVIGVNVFAEQQKPASTENSAIGEANNNEPVQPNQPVVTAPPKNLCPALTKTAALNFEWGNDWNDNKRLYLMADFLIPAEFADGWTLDNLPSSASYSTDAFVCEKGSEEGESVNKLYCKVTISYTPRLKKNTVGADGTITKTDNLYIKTFVFDASSTDMTDPTALEKLPIESMKCDDSSY